jgi:hypothetical protein
MAKWWWPDLRHSPGATNEDWKINLKIIGAPAQALRCRLSQFELWFIFIYINEISHVIVPLLYATLARKFCVFFCGGGGSTMQSVKARWVWVTGTNQGSTPVPRPVSEDCRSAGGIWSVIWGLAGSFERDGWSRSSGGATPHRCTKLHWPWACFVRPNHALTFTRSEELTGSITIRLQLIGGLWRPTGTKTRNGCAGEGQKQFNPLSWKPAYVSE